MTHDPMDELIGREARDYNTPGDVPRDRMWQEIQAARARRQAAPSRRVAWIWPTLAVAAALLLAVGVLIGRRWERDAPVAAGPGGRHQADDIDQIEQSIDRRGVMTKLRTTIPGRLATGS